MVGALETFLRKFPHGEFYPTTFEWRPTTLVPASQTALLISAAYSQYDELVQLEGFLMLTDKSSQYLQRIRRMGLNVRRASFVRLSNQLRFFQYILNFYSDYAYIVRWLHHEPIVGDLR